MSKLNNCARAIIGLTVIFSAIIYIFPLLYPSGGQPVYFFNLPFDIVSEEVVPGGTVQFESALCRTDYTTLDFELHWRNLSGGKSLNGERFTGLSGAPGCATIYPEYNVPESIEPGDYVLELRLIYHINWLKKQRVTVSTERFTISP